ncbi:MAG: response regulator [bacterium]
MSAKQKILVADDDPDIIEQLSVILVSQGYEVATAASQRETEDVLLGFQPDLAIIDLMMEQKDSGFVLCHQIKKLYPDTRIILLTAVMAETGISFDEQSEASRSWIKADKIMDKPVRAEQLSAEIHRLLGTEAIAHGMKH